jgi:hypothetical protein
LDVPIKSLFSVYGATAAVCNWCPELHESIQIFLRPFVQRRNQPVGRESCGQIRRFDLAEVTRSLADAGESQRRCDPLVSIYSHNEQHWILDDRWGVCEIDLLRHRWRSWVLPQTLLDPMQLAEAAVLQPMAHLLRLSGVELIPAVALERSGWATLIIAPYPIPTQISRAVRAGYRVIGQRWVALVRRTDRVVLRHLPGAMEAPAGGGKSIGRRLQWIDITANNPWATAQTAWCDAVAVISPGRCSRSRARILLPAEVQSHIRHAWPVSTLGFDKPSLRHTASILSRRCLCVSMQLSRHEDEFLNLIESMRKRTAPKVEVSIQAALRGNSAYKYQTNVLNAGQMF